MKYLITYTCCSKGKVSWHYSIESSVEDWVAKTQGDINEEYYLVNALSVTNDFCARWENDLKGM